jgi:hypothetical protein
MNIPSTAGAGPHFFWVLYSLAGILTGRPFARISTKPGVHSPSLNHYFKLTHWFYNFHPVVINLALSIIPTDIAYPHSLVSNSLLRLGKIRFTPLLF